MPDNSSVTTKTPAKINLGLEVLRRRPDDYHDLNTVFAAIDLYDTIELTANDSGGVRLRILGDDTLGSEPSEENLCVRAVRIAAELCGRRASESGIEIVLRKSIPTGAGLGGGSSDAAATLMEVLRLWGVDPASIGPNELIAAGAALGSDVPFFLNGGIALAGSRGERLSPLDLVLPWSVLLVHPGIHVSTGEAYRTINRTDERRATDLGRLLREALHRPEILRDGLINDFETPVFAAHPLLRDIKERLYVSGAVTALMSGSGSTLFGLFESETGAAEAAARFDDFGTHACRFIL